MKPATKPKRPGGPHRVPDPHHATIKAACRAIQESWSDLERAHRAGLTPTYRELAADAVDTPVISTRGLLP